MNILIVENEPFTVDDIEMKLNEIGYSSIRSADNVLEAVQLIDARPPSVVLVDIELNGELDGIDLGEILNTRNIPFIYLSKLQDIDTFERAKKTSPSANIPKPVGRIQLRNAISLALDRPQKQSFESYVVVPSGSKKIKIEPEQILYLKAAGNNCEIHLMDEKKVRHLSSTPMGHVLKKIPMKSFCQVHRSYIVNLKKVHSFEGGRLFMDTEPKIEIPISNSFLGGFKGRFNSL